MTREEAKELLPIIQAFAEGKKIEFRNKRFNEEWKELKQIPELSYNSFEYRIKPNYRPFKNAEECWQEMAKHQPFGWIKFQGYLFLIVHIDDKSIGYENIYGMIMHNKFNNILKDFTFNDGTPFGILNE